MELFGKPALKWSDDDIVTAVKVFSDCEAKGYAARIDSLCRGRHDRSDCEGRNAISSQSQRFEHELRRAVMTARSLDAQKKGQQQAKIELEKAQAETRRAQADEEAQRKEQELRAQAQRDKEAADEARRAAESEAPNIAEATKEAEEARRARQEAEQRLAAIRGGIDAEKTARDESLGHKKELERQAAAREGYTDDATTVRVYAGTMANEMPKVVSGIAAMRAACGTNNVDQCGRGLDIAAASVSSLQNQMASLAVPGCLQEVDTTLRDALKLLDHGYTTSRNGFTLRNETVVYEGMHGVQSGNQLLDQAVHLLNMVFDRGTCLAQ